MRSTAPRIPGSGAPRAPPPSTGARRKEEGFWVAVLPFSHRGSDPAVEALAEGMSEDVVTGLARFSYLQVISRSSALKHSGAVVAVRLVDATTGAHLWAETCNRPFEADRIFEIQRPASAPAIVTEAEGQVSLGLAGLPGFEDLRDDPRFGAFLARIGLPASTADRLRAPCARGAGTCW